MTSVQSEEQATLKREIGVVGAVLLGLGSIIGTGVFVSIGVAAGVTGGSVVLAVVVGAFVATMNGLSSAQLAANHPVSGGAYEYGYRWLSPSLGFAAGWMFLCAKSASAATAALGCSGYLLSLFGREGTTWSLPLLAVAIVLVMTLVVSVGIKRSNQANVVIVSITLLALALFCVVGAVVLLQRGEYQLSPFWADSGDAGSVSPFLTACALMFVAYTGYGRIATLGEEVVEPRKTIPIAIVVTLIISALVYVSVAAIAVGAVGPTALAETTTGTVAPLEVVARRFDVPLIGTLVGVGAITAMLGVLLNLILGLSRVVLAMGRRHDLPGVLSGVDAQSGVPIAATVAVGLLVGGLALLGSVKAAWTFSAVTVLIYYAVMNAAALKLHKEERLYPRWTAWLGLCFCLGLAAFVPGEYWIYAAIMLSIGFVVRVVCKANKSGRK